MFGRVLCDRRLLVVQKEALDQPSASAFAEDVRELLPLLGERAGVDNTLLCSFHAHGPTTLAVNSPEIASLASCARSSTKAVTSRAMPSFTSGERSSTSAVTSREMAS